jgi:hypothetical protein
MNVTGNKTTAGEQGIASDCRKRRSFARSSLHFRLPAAGELGRCAAMPVIHASNTSREETVS